MPDATDCWYLTGPTASGKTAVGVELARLLNAEIVSLDSMAVYRGMDIGTAKPTTDERQAVPHHLIDILAPNEQFSVAAFRARALETIADIRRRSREVLFVGGTPLYLKATLRGIFEGPPADLETRRRLEANARQTGIESLHARLATVDPAAAKRLHPNDARRIIRALEVFEQTGTPISVLQRQFDVGRTAAECRVFVLDWPRAKLYERINRRVDDMFGSGLVEETRRLVERYGQLSRTARQAVGYREVIEHLEGHRDLVQTIEWVKNRTRQFAKRQLTWFRSLSECRTIPVSEPFDPSSVARQIVELGRTSSVASETPAPQSTTQPRPTT
jgi:tRNA dimethylallyltransferase